MLSIIFYILFLTFTLAYFVAFCVVFMLTAAFDRERRIVHWCARQWTRVYFNIIPSWRVQTEGMDLFDRKKAYVVVVNHTSMLDIPLMFVVPLWFKWVSKREVYKWPLFGWVLWMRGDITIERGSSKAVRKMIADGTKHIERGTSVVVFPEGTRSKTGRVGKFKEGAFTLAKSAGVGIIPCVALGTGTAFNGWRLNFRNRYIVKALPVIAPEEVAVTSPAELAAKVQAMIAAEHEKLVAASER